MSKKRIVVTGAAGFIGHSLAAQLLEAGHEVIGIDNFEDNYPRSFKERNLESCITHPQFSLYPTSYDDSLTWQTIFAEGDVDIVFHLAASVGVRDSLSKAEVYYQNNVTSFENLLLLMQEHGVKSLVFASSSSVYGPDVDLPFDEEKPLKQWLSPYAQSKARAEEKLRLACEKGLFKAQILRLFTVYGPNQRPDLVLHKFVEKIVDDEEVEIYGAGDSERDYTFIDDVTRAFNLSMENLEKQSMGHCETFNIGTGNPTALNTLIDLIEEKMQKKANRKYIDPHRADLQKTQARTEKAKKAFGFHSKTTLSEGIDLFLKWYLKPLVKAANDIK